ncbi:MAG: DUF3899 domain-containing protein [Clostridia bacterium]|nr:DUF3899 domain-containing protein [Clostridia bacterium]
MNRKRLNPLFIAAGAGLLAAALTAWRQGILDAASPKESYRILCDACFIPGVILCGVGLMSLIAYGGFFDIFSYGFKSVVWFFKPLREKKKKKYYDYRMEKEARRQKPRYYILKVGLVFMLLAVIFLILFERAGS